MGLDDIFASMLEPLIKEKAEELLSDFQNALRTHNIDLKIYEIKKFVDGPSAYKIEITITPKGDELYELAQGGTD